MSGPVLPHALWDACINRDNPSQGWHLSVGNGRYYACKHCGVEIEFAYVEALGVRASEDGTAGLDIVYTCQCPETKSADGAAEAVHIFRRRSVEAEFRLYANGRFPVHLPYRAAPARHTGPMGWPAADQALGLMRIRLALVKSVADFLRCCEGAPDA